MTEQGTHRCVYLVDCNTDTERKILHDWILGARSDSSSHKVVELDLRGKDVSGEELASLGACLDNCDSDYLVPLRVAWFPVGEERDQRTGLKDLLTGNTHSPGKFRQWMIRDNTPAPYEVLVAEGATVTDLRGRYAAIKANRSEEYAFPEFVLKAAFLSLERAERGLKGSRYKIPKMFPHEVIGDHSLVQPVLEQLSEECGESVEALRKKALDCLREMEAGHSAFSIDLVASIGRFLYTRGFDEEIDCLEEDLERVKKLMKEKPIAFLFTHKSHIDGFMLLTMFYDQDFTPVHIFGGINMKLPGIGSLFKKAGSIFLRRSFQNDRIYKAVFKSYIDYLGRNRFPLLWALEGTRSRTGKLMPPRYGLLNYVISAYSHGDDADIVFMPVSTIYDQVPEVRDYDAIQGGAKKRPESASWAVEYVAGLKRAHGKIHVRFGQGVSLSELANPLEESADNSDRLVQKLAFRLSVDANNVTPITPIAVITYGLLSHGHKAMTEPELIRELWPVLRLIHKMDLPRTSEFLTRDESALARSLGLLVSQGVVSKFDDGQEPVYAIASGAGRSAAYYRNGMIHFFVNGAIADLALAGIRDDAEAPKAEQFREMALGIRDLFKFEFFFEDSEQFLNSLNEDLELRAPGWNSALQAGESAVRKLLRSMSPILGYGTLRPFLEAYALIAEILANDASGSASTSGDLVAAAFKLGKQRLRQQRIQCEESLSTNYFENAVNIAAHRGLLDAGDNVRSQRIAFRDELLDLVYRAKLLASIAESQLLDQRRE